MKARKVVNFALYAMAAGFLALHLLPIGSVLASFKPEPTTNATLAAKAECTNGDFDVLTFGNPLTDPLYVSLNNSERLVAPVPSGVNLVSNSKALELGTNGKPTGWLDDKYGQSNTTFSLVRNALPNANALRVEVRDYQAGDAKWLMDPVAVKEGQIVNVSFQYRSQQDSDVVATYINERGETRYVNVTQLTNTNNQWMTYRGDIVIPPGTKQLQIAQALTANGVIESTNYSITSRPISGFQRGIVSVTFDDGWGSIYEKGLPLFEKYRIPTTQFVVANYDKGKAYMTEEQITSLQKKGHEIGSHSYSHAKLTQQNSSELHTEVAGSQAVLQDRYTGSASNFAAPFGVYNDEVSQKIAQCYQSHRTTDTGYNTAGYDRYQVRVQNVEVDTTPAEVKRWVDYAQQNKLWLVLVYHQVENGGEYAVDTSALEAQLKVIADSGIHAATYNDALLETYPQGRQLAPYSGF